MSRAGLCKYRLQYIGLGSGSGWDARGNLFGVMNGSVESWRRLGSTAPVGSHRAPDIGQVRGPGGSKFLGRSKRLLWLAARGAGRAPQIESFCNLLSTNDRYI